MFDDHEGRVGHVHAHFDHRGADQHAHLAAGEERHHGLLLGRGHARVQQTDHAARQGLAQIGVGGGGVGEVQRLALFDQRAHPIHLPPGLDLGADACDHLVLAAVGNEFGDDGRAARGQLIDDRHIEVGVVAHGQRARDRGGTHHEHVGLHAMGCEFLPQGQPLRHAKTVLLVDDGQRQVLELHLLLDHGVGAHHQRGLAAGHQRQHGGAVLFLLPAHQPGHLAAALGQQGFEPADHLGEMLLGQDFGRRHQRALPTRVHRQTGGQGRDHGFARAHIALQQPVHGHLAGQVGGNFFAHAALGGREAEGQHGQQLLMQRQGTVGGFLGAQHGRTQHVACAARLLLRQLLGQ
ncbi:hypothetical protein D3C71_1382200 [compost metagenome]